MIDIKEAETDLLACATFLAEKIGSSDGHSEAIKEILPYYLAKKEVDLAAELADAIDDPFVRDQLLVSVAEKCAELGDDDYALQLVESIEESSFQGVALEQISIQNAINTEFEKALKIADSLEHGSNAYAAIAGYQEKAEALKTVEKIEFPYVKAHALQTIALNSKDINLLEKATEVAQDIEFEEERIRAYLEISYQYIESKRKDKAIEVLDKARQFVETLDSIQRDSFFSQIANGFLKAGSLDLADRALDLVSDKYEMAHALVGFADEFLERGEETDALESLEEAYQILKSQPEKETRNSKAKYNLFGLIAGRFATFGKLERGIEIANENPYDEIRNNALSQIAIICETNLNDDLAQRALGDIDDESERTLAMIGLSDVNRRNQKSEFALKQLKEAYFHLNSVQQISMKSLIFNRLAERFNILGEPETARKICSENLLHLTQILDESHRVKALAELSATFAALEFKLNDSDTEILRTMIRKASW